MKRTNRILTKIIYIAVFTALCFIGTSIMIPFGSSKVHLGNFFCIFAGLLCGGLVGGLSGAIGMGLNDLVFGYGVTVAGRTFILKFLMGFVAGFLFRLLVKRKINGILLAWISAILMLGFLSFEVTMYLMGKSGYSLLLIIMTSILSLLLLLNAIFSFRLDHVLRSVSFAMIVAISVNVIGEFFLRILFAMMVGTTYEAALATSFAKLPASLFTSVVTMIMVLPLFYPVYKATRKVNQLNDLDSIIKINVEEQEDKSTKTLYDKTK
jgi:uncharacterized membrane protein